MSDMNGNQCDKNVEKCEDLLYIKDWLAKQSHLPKKVEDVLIMRFLHTCNYSLEKTKALLDLFFTIRSQAPELFYNRDPMSPSTQKVFQITDMVPLPKTTKENYKLFIYRLADFNADNFNYVDAIKTFFMMSDTRMLVENDITNGEIPIFDMAGFSLRHITKVPLPILKKYMVYTQEAHPIKLKQIHIVNAPSFVDRAMAMVRPFLKSEVAKLLHFHTPNSTTLYDFVPKELLPEEYGGSIGKLETFKRDWIKKLEDNREYFTDDSRWEVVESERPSGNKNGKNLLGMQGAFRTLCID